MPPLLSLFFVLLLLFSHIRSYRIFFKRSSLVPFLLLLLLLCCCCWYLLLSLLLQHSDLLLPCLCDSFVQLLHLRLLLLLHVIFFNKLFAWR